MKRKTFTPVAWDVWVALDEDGRVLGDTRDIGGTKPVGDGPWSVKYTWVRGVMTLHPGQLTKVRRPKR